MAKEAMTTLTATLHPSAIWGHLAELVGTLAGTAAPRPAAVARRVRSRRIPAARPPKQPPDPQRHLPALAASAKPY